MLKIGDKVKIIDVDIHFSSQQLGSYGTIVGVDQRERAYVVETSDGYRGSYRGLNLARWE